MRRNVFKPYTKSRTESILRAYFNLSKLQADMEIERLSACVVRDNLDVPKYLELWESKLDRGTKGNIRELYSLYPFYQKYPEYLN